MGAAVIRLVLLCLIVAAPASAQQRIRARAVSIAVPGTPTNLSPACGATGVSTSPTISFDSTGATSYSIKLDTFSPPTTVVSSSNTYIASGLSQSTVYYYIAVGTNSGGSSPSSVCSFTTTGPSTFQDRPRLPPWQAARLARMAAARDANTTLYQASKSEADIKVAQFTGFTNNAYTTSTILSTATTGGTFTVDDGSVFPASSFKVRVGVEVISISTRSGNTLTINERGTGLSNTPCDGYTIQTQYTPLIAHPSGTPVFQHTVTTPGGTSTAVFGIIAMNKLGVTGYTGATGIAKVRAALSFAAACAHVYYHDYSNFRWGGYFFAVAFDGAYDYLTATERTYYCTQMMLHSAYHFAHPKVDGTVLRQRQRETGHTANQGNGQIHGWLSQAAACYGVDSAADANWNAAFTLFTDYMVPGMVDGPFAGGQTIEGAEYMSESQYQTWTILAMVKSAKNLDYYGSVGNWPLNLAKFFLYSARPDSTPASTHVLTNGDNYVTALQDYVPNNYPQIAMAQAMDYLGTANPTYASYLRYLHDTIYLASQNGYLPEKFTWWDESVSAVNYKTAGLPTIYAACGLYNTGLIAARSDWTSAATWANFFVGSERWDHIHSEYGNYQIGRNGVYLTRNVSGYLFFYDHYGAVPGNVGEYYFAGSAGHNTVHMNNHSAATWQTISGGPALTERCIVDPNYAYARGDMSLVYKDVDQPWSVLQPVGAAGFNGLPTTDDADLWKRDWIYIKPDLVAFYDRLGYKNASTSPTRWNAIFPVNPTVTGQKIEVATGGQKLQQDILWPTGATLTKKQLNTEDLGTNPVLEGWRIQTQSGVSAASEESFQVIQVGASADTFGTPTLLTSTNALCSQPISAQVICFMRGASPTASVTFAYSGTPKIRIVGLTASTAYHFVTSGGIATLSAATGSGDTTTNAAGILEYN